MKKHIISWLRRLADWLEGPLPVSPIHDTVKRRAKELTEQLEEVVHTSGEYKRHIVYATLLKEFPDEPKRYIALQIELALQ